jgi:glutamate synthase (NADPH) small chain
MGHPTGFLDAPRVSSTTLPVDERVRNWREFTVAVPDAELARQGSRCMDCGVPYCHALGCPLGNLIPEWNDLVYRGDWRGALTRLEMTNPLPEVTGRICPAPCEASCTLSINSSPVTIKCIERAIVERGFADGAVTPRPPSAPTGRRVAVVGSGPAGLAAAQTLRRRGHEVTVFERARRAGGLLRYGIPDFKLEKTVLDRRIAQMAAEGVRFECGVEIGEDISPRYLRTTYDVILLAMGAGEPRDLDVPGRGLSGVHFALDYLGRSSQFLAGEIPESELISAKGMRVVVIGGGDTGSDCVGTANRQGAKEVHQFEIMPRPEVWTEAWNPNWPWWPNILRTSSSHEEGCVRDWAVATESLEGADGRVTQGRFSRVEWKKAANGQMKMECVPGSSFTLKADLVLLAMGFMHVKHGKLIEELGAEYDPRGNIRTGPGYATSAKGVFAAGDAGTGASLVVRALFHGREAAASIDGYLRG